MYTLISILSVAAGGALGASLRYGVNVGVTHWLGHGFPWATLSVNVLGSLLMGVLVAVFAHFWDVSHAIKVFLVTGFLGAFTTFSAFSLDVSVLYENDKYIEMAAYILASVILSIAALFAGMLIVRQFA